MASTAGSTSKQLLPGEQSKPAKPLSAYGLFFRDTVRAIKEQNPTNSFEELSKIVASMWDVLDAAHKEVYQNKSELMKKEFFKQQSASNDLQTDGNGQQHTSYQQVDYKINNTIMATANRLDEKSDSSAEMARGEQLTTLQQVNQTNNATTIHSDEQSLTQFSSQADSSVEDATGKQQSINQQFDLNQINSTSHSNEKWKAQFGTQPSIEDTTGKRQRIGQQVDNENPTNNKTTTHSDEKSASVSPDAETLQQCIRNGCTKTAIKGNGWEDEYCSNECVVIHCREVFNAWVRSNLDSN